MAGSDTQPTEPLPDWARGDWEHAEAPKRRVWPWIVAFAIVAVLAVVAWFAAEAIARQVVTNVIVNEVRTQLSLPASHEIDVELGGAVVPQLIGGSLSEVTVSSEDVPVGDLSGDVTVVAQDVPIRGGEMSGATATVSLDEDQLRDLLSSVEGFPAESVGLDTPDVTMETELQLFGAGIPVGVSLTPSAEDGGIVLTPASLQLAGSDVTADALRSQFGVIADVVLRDWTVCIAGHIPTGIVLTSVEVQDDELVAVFDVAGGILSDASLMATGTCEEG